MTFAATRANIAAAGDAPGFRSDPVPPALLEEILAVATRRLPARFAEPPWRFVVVMGREREQLVAHVAANPATVTRVLPLSSICRYLERIGDHVKNLAEEVIFMVQATDVRHRAVT